jgi:hypothetical protein
MSCDTPAQLGTPRIIALCQQILQIRQQKGDIFEFFFDFVVLCDGSGFQTEMRAKLVDRFDSIQALTDFPDILGVNCVVILENTQ